MRTVLTAALAAALALGAAPSAGAARTTRPVVMLASGGEQVGELASATVHQGRGRTCTSTASVARTSPPPAVPHDGGPLSWRIPGKQRPARTELRMRMVTFQHPETGAQLNSYTTQTGVELTPVRENGAIVAWLATTSGRVLYGDFDVLFKVVWVGRCGNDMLEYRFHTQSLPTNL